MRTNKKQQLLATAMDIVESDGLQGLTYDSLSTATGTSKSGLIYHFPSRRALEVELNKYSASLWTQALEDIAGAPPQQLDLPLRLKAIVINQSTSARRADLFLTLQSLPDPEIRRIWTDAWQPWSEGIAENSAALFILTLADGLWTSDHVNPTPLSATERQLIVEQAVHLSIPCNGTAVDYRHMSILFSPHTRSAALQILFLLQGLSRRLLR